MSKAVEGVGKLVRKAAPVLIPVGIGIATGGFGLAAGAAGSGIASGASGAAAGAAGAGVGGMAAMGAGGAAAAGIGGAAAGGAAAGSQLLGVGASIFGSMAASSASPVAQGAAPQAVPAAAPVATGEASGGIIGRAMGWIEKNPTTSKLIGGAVAGGAEAYQRGRELDEIKRQFDESRKFSGSFYGIPRGGIVAGRQRQQFF